MSPRDTATLAYRLAGVYVLVEAIPLASQWTQALFMYLQWSPAAWPLPFSTLLAQGIGPLLLLTLAMALFLYSRFLARWTCAQSDASPLPQTTGVAVLAYSVVGLAVAVSGLPRLVLACIALPDFKGPWWNWVI